MILISHRGNLDGPNPQQENRQQYLLDAVQRGYQVEVDVWFVQGSFYLGHDDPQYLIDSDFLRNPQFWCHAKNIEALCEMKRLNEEQNFDIHYFWHQEDDVTLTSKGFIWAYPGKQPITGSIAVMPEHYDDTLNVCIGICSDFIITYT